MKDHPNTFLAAIFLPALAICLLGAPPALAKERDGDAAKEAALGHSVDLEQPAPPRRLPDFTKGDPMPPPPKGGWPTWQFGPTGIIGMKNAGGDKGDQVRVISVMPGSPAEGKVLPGDVLLGVQGKMFELGGSMNRLAGNAIIDAETEAGRGDLSIRIWRDRNWLKRTGAKDVFNIDLDKMFKEAEGTADIYEWESEKERTVAVKQMAYDEFPIDGVYTNFPLRLDVMGTYSETSPWDCPVIQKVRDNALKVIAERIKPDVRGRSKRGSSWPDILALVASGDPEYLALAKAWVRRLPKGGKRGLCMDMEYEPTIYDVTYGGMQSWHHGFNYLEMAIYYDATGDDYILPEVRRRAIVAALGQNGGGSWGHTFAFPHFNGGMLHKCNPGYGAMNNAGGRCFFLLTLAKKAGIEHPEINAAIWRADRFFRTFVDKGCIPYGYHSPYGSDDSNGKNYGPAYAFYALGRKYEAKYFSMHSAHASFTRRGGHGSPTLWYYTPLSAHMAGPKAVQAYMRNMRYFYTLSRRHDGSFIFLGEQAPGIGGRGMRNATAYVTMHLSAPLKQLMITGKDADDNFWMTDEELEELLISARGDGKRGQIEDPALLKKVGKAWPERSTDELIALLDHFYPNMRRALAAELGKRYAAGEKEILKKIVPLLGNEEARMRDGACKALSACGTDPVLANMSKVVAMLNDDAEFVRMQAARSIGGATEPGEEKRELAMLNATVDEYAGMTMDNGNVRNAIKGVLFPRRRGKGPDLGKLTSSPFQAGYDEELVRLAMEKIVTMDPQGTVPGGWDKEALLKLAGPVTFSAAERQVNDAMFGGARKSEAQALLRKHGYREAVEGDAFNVMERSRLERSKRRGVGYKDPFITPKLVKNAPGQYRGVLDDLRLWQLDNPTLVLSEKTAKGKPPILTPLNLLIEIIEKDTDNEALPTIGPDVAKMFQAELTAAGDAAAQLTLCRKELEDLERKNYWRKMHAMTHLAETLGTKAIDDVSPFLGHEHWRVREHTHKLAVQLMEGEAAKRLVELFGEAQARESGLQGNWNAAGILNALVAAQHKPALEIAKTALKHGDPLVRRAAVRAVFAIGGDAELKTVFAFLRQATAAEDFDGAELALLSKKNDPAHVQRVSKVARTLLAAAGSPSRTGTPARPGASHANEKAGGTPRTSSPASHSPSLLGSGRSARPTEEAEFRLRRSLAWVLGQFGGEANLAAIQQAAEATEDDTDLTEMALALAYSPDRAASDNLLALIKVSKRVRDVVAPLAIHRMVGRNGMGDVSDAERVRFARGILNLTYDDQMVSFLSRVHTGQAMQLLYDVMKINPSTSAKSIIASAEGIRHPSKLDSQIATEVLADVIEYIEVTHLRGGMTEQIQDWRESMGYVEWKGLQARAGQALLKFHKPKETAIPEFDDMDLDL